jgi:cytochrome b561
MIAQETKGHSATAKVLHWLVAALVEDGEVND